MSFVLDTWRCVVIALAIAVATVPARGSTPDARAAFETRYEELWKEFQRQRLPEGVRKRIEALLDEQRVRLGPNDLLVLKTEVLLAKVIRDIGEMERALELADHALEELVKGGLEVTYEGFEARVVKGQILDEMGRSKRAIAEYERLIDLSAAPAVARYRFLAFLELVLSYGKLGRLGDAAAIGERALREMSDDVDGAVRAALLDNLAGVYLDLGRIDEAVEMQQRAQAAFVARYGEDHEATLSAASNLALTLSAAGHHEEAVRISGDSARRLQAKVAVPPRNLLTARLVYANYLLAASQLDAAELEYRELLQQWIRQFGPDDTGSIDSRYGLARVAQERGKLQSARQQLEAVCADYARVGDTKERGPRDCPLRLSALMWQLGERRAALDRLSSNLTEFEERIESGRLTDQSQQTLFAQRAPAFRQWAEWSILLKDESSAFVVSERLRARQLLQSVVFRHADSSGALKAEEEERLGTLKARIEELSIAVQSEDNGEARARLTAEREERYRELMALRATLRSSNPRYAALSQVRTVDPRQAATLVSQQTVAISYLLGDTRAFAFVIRRGAPLRVVDLGPLRGLEDEVRAAVALFSRDPTTQVWQRADGSLSVATSPPEPTAKRIEDWTVPARRLGVRLLHPLARHLQGHTNLLVIPDGFLARLPFEPLALNGRPLVQSYSVAYVQSLSVLAAMRQRPRSSATAALISIGAPDFDGDSLSRPIGARRVELATLMRGTASDPGAVRRAYELMGVHWEALPGAQREIEQAQALFTPKGAVTALTGSRASESELQQLNNTGELTRYRVAHVATHVLLNARAPALSAVVLSQKQTTASADGYLTAAELPGYRFDTELIVMSACESGRGPELAGEGVLGLPYALFVAGNRAAVLTLWKVVDESTSRFTVSVLQGVAGGRAAAESLAHTKRRFMRDKRVAHPLHWAPFVVYGE